MQPKPINILSIRFANEISQQEIPLFRGAVIHSLENKSILFHNHEGEKFRYAYPLIQYKRIRGKAAIVCLNQGTENIGELFSNKLLSLQLNERNIDVSIEKIIPQKFRIQIWDHQFPYRINKWVPFNSNNYHAFKQIESLNEKIQFLENILKGNILSFAKGIGIHFEKEVQCIITKCTEIHSTTIKGVSMQCFDVQFKCNVSIPNYIGLGKHASINFGVVTQVKKEKIEQ